MAVIQVKKYKTIKDENGNKIQVPKTKEEWDKETCKGAKTWYFATRYKLNEEVKPYKSKLFALKREAEEDERLFKDNPIEYIKNHSKRAKNNINMIIPILNENDKLKNYFKEFLIDEVQYVRPGTLYDHECNWRLHLFDTFGELTPKQINLSLVKKWHALTNNKINPRNNRSYSIKTKNKWHSTLSEFCNFLYQNGLIEMNYAKVVGEFKNPNVNKNTNSKIRYQTLEEFQMFMSVVDDEFWYALFNFLFWHGPRKGEQRALKIRNVNLEHDALLFEETFARNEKGGEIIGPIKNGKIRKIYLAEQSRPYIEKLINFYKNMDGYNENWFLFGGPYNTYKNRIEDKLKYYYKKLEEKYPNKKINCLTHHEFGRHSHASYLLEEGLKKGLSLEEIYAIIAQRLGDTVEVVKRTYAHLYEKENNDKAKNILN